MGLFGIGDVKIELQLSSNTIQPNGILEGIATLTLNHDINAKGVIATLTAVKMLTGVQGKQYPETVYHEQQILDTEKVYLKNENPHKYTFKFSIPEQTAATASSGRAASYVSALTSPAILMSSPGDAKGPVRWWIEVKLDIPHSLEVAISKTQELNMVEK